MMLAGDVTVFISDIQLFVVGDDAANQIQIVGSANGSARVVGLDGTTINGGTNEFVANLPGLRYGNVQMNGGNDAVDITGARFNNGLFVNGGAGNDSMIVRNSSIGHFHAFAGSGDDVLQINNLFATRSSTIDMQTGNDMIAIMAHASGDNIVIRGGAGNDVLAVDNMGMFGSLQVDMAAGNDQVLMAGETWVGRDSQISLGSEAISWVCCPIETAANPSGKSSQLLMAGPAMTMSRSARESQWARDRWSMAIWEPMPPFTTLPI